MRKGEMGRQLRYGAVITAAILSLVGAEPGLAHRSRQTPPARTARTAVAELPPTPIKHVIIIIGENRTFDHVFATYKPKPGQTVWNLLSEQIVKEDGSPGANYSKVHAVQRKQLPQLPVGAAVDPLYDAACLPRRRRRRLVRTPYGCQLLGITLRHRNRLQYARQRGEGEKVRKWPRARLLSISAHRRNWPDRRRQHRKHARSRRAHLVRRPGREQFAARPSTS